MEPDARPPAARKVSVRQLRAEDLAGAARLQVHELPEGFFSRLGPRFLQRYLGTYLDGPVAVALAADVDGRRVGHLVGTVGPGHYAWVLRRRWSRLLPVALLALARRPALALELVRTRLRRYARAVVATARGAAQVAETAVTTQGGAVPRGPAALLHVAVEPEARGSGAGSALVRAFEDRASAVGCDSAQLVTFAGDPSDASSGAGPFYERLGWARTGERVDEHGRQVLVYSRPL